VSIARVSVTVELKFHLNVWESHIFWARIPLFRNLQVRKDTTVLPGLCSCQRHATVGRSVSPFWFGALTTSESFQTRRIDTFWTVPNPSDWHVWPVPCLVALGIRIRDIRARTLHPPGGSMLFLPAFMAPGMRTGKALAFVRRARTRLVFTTRILCFRNFWRGKRKPLSIQKKKGEKTFRVRVPCVRPLSGGSLPEEASFSAVRFWNVFLYFFCCHSQWNFKKQT